MLTFSASRPLLRLSSQKADVVDVAAEVAVVATVVEETVALEVVTAVAVAAVEVDVVARSLPTKTSPPCE